MNKKLNYRKDIARPLRTQYVEGIYSNTMTLKSGLGGRWRSLETASLVSCDYNV